MTTTGIQVPFNDLHAHYLSIRDEIDSAIAAVIAESAFVRGPHVERFEGEFAAAIGVEHCVSCANGTDALYIAMRGLGLEPGDEVVTTAHSWIATSETITQAGGRVVFVDTDPKTYTIDPSRIEARITPRTRGIIPVHLYGQPADMDAIMTIASRHGLWVLEDCAQAHLATYKGRQVGTFGRAATYSFYPGKNLGAMGDAGAIVTNDADLAQWMALYARHGGKGNHLIEGINSRLDGLQAAILSAKLPHLRNWTAARRRIAEAYDRGLAGVGDLVLPHRGPNRDHVFHLYVIQTSKRDTLREFLGARGIQSQVNYPRCLPACDAYAHLGHGPADFPSAWSAQDRILSLPIYPEMGDDQVDSAIAAVRDFYEGA
ncbi:MAG: DegT/DnrJ/EryC1/StrS family aminotransferase [Phycisphaerales bacterium]|nr:DegT/DnrJ/EryC1/StrS family aminotransferase [Phycisphaerales bacterium]